MQNNNVLVLCHDVIGKKMAGPGIRYTNVAKQLSTVSDVTLAYFSNKTKFDKQALEINRDGEEYKSIFDKHNIIFAQWLSLDMLNYAKSKNIDVIFDLYAPVPIEYMASVEFSETINKTKDVEFEGLLEVYKYYFENGSLFVCSNQRQKNFWLGYATSLGLLKPSDFSDQNSLVNKIIIGPMGIENTPNKKANLKLRKELGLTKNDFVLLWTGGIWDWFDACTVIKAVAKTGKSDIKLVFLGTKHPNDNVKEMSESYKARKLSEDLGLTNKNVYFMDGWIDYNSRHNYMLDADAAIYCDKSSLETEFSHRTRVLDHVWLGLPTICSRGDYFSDLIENKELGITTKRTAGAFSEAILQLYTNNEYAARIKVNINKIKTNFTWDSTLSGIVQYVKNNDPNKSHGYSEKETRVIGSKPKIHQRAKRKLIRIARNGLDRIE